MIWGLVVGAFFGLLVAWVGSFFDPNVDNRYAKIAGLIVFVLIFASYAGLIHS